ncbi:MAG: sigma-54-dependent Fis family transcriptional regulator [Alphaproteobacteria bacterium]|nr:sigma-54-dependent Fis family transcriptional regulator [Alphaproteobacteria bacterium]MBL6936923.1 sigma-54-dependent Fis family transcriptional regulator [Alphaproteobacteria bacterium]MBL7097692.1 sigma-54-dependent Fis family transcriptional regulator [Alphaproteobacteria bacterium]
MAQTILVVDDDPVQRRLLEAAITRSGMHVVTAPGGGPALDLINGPRGEQINLVLLDLVMPDMGGLEVLNKIRPAHPELPVIVLTAKGGIDSAVEAMRAGANDFLVKPASPERISISIRNQLKIGTLSGEVKQLKKRTENRLTFDDLIAKSAEMKQVFRLGARAAQSNIPILIEGESGAGKELIARAIQGSSDRAGKPFVTVNCGAIPENLIESILFGHEKGSFTGATDKHLGKFQEADGGTLFLDEIGELRLDMQVKLLRALQEGEVDPVGSKRPVKVDVRIISATNRDLAALSRDGAFREDLFYRLNVFPIYVPSLRDRREDVEALARHFIARFAAEENKPVAGLTPDASELLEKFNWPGNVRQLENTIFRAVVLCDSSMLDVCDFPQIAAALGVDARAARPAPPSQALPTAHHGVAAAGAPASSPGYAPIVSTAHPSPYQLSGTDIAGHMRRLEDIESEVIRMAISRYDGHMSEVARRLGIGRSTLYRKLKELGLEPVEAEAPSAEAAAASRQAAG